MSKTLTIAALLVLAGIGVGLETRVGGFDLGNPASVRGERTLTLSTHPGYGPAYDVIASGSLLAAKGSTGRRREGLSLHR